MSKHTPEVTSGGYTGRIIDENGDTVAIVNNYDQAILMASAPELLEALKLLLHAVNFGSPQAKTSALLNARGIIAKAEVV